MSSPARIAFVVPGHESGPCGVTDYAFWLAGSAASEGVRVLILCLHQLDASAYLARIPPTAREYIELIRPTSSPLAPDEITRALRTFGPDYVSLQFSPPAFRDGRLIYPRLSSICARLRPYSVFLTVHETWTQVGVPASARSLVLARFRRIEILLAWRRLRPVRVFASNPHHIDELTRVGLRPTRLPIFSNLPGTPRPASPLNTSTVLAGLAEPPPGVASMPPRAYVALFFARIRPEFDPVPVLARLRAEATAAGRPLLLLSVGETGYSGRGWDRVASAARDLLLICLGRRPGSEITRILHAADCGVSPTPLPFWQKSSACAAMVAHGLPLVFSETAVSPGVALPAHFATLGSSQLEWHSPPAGQVATLASPDEIWRLMNTHPLSPSCVSAS